MDSVRIQELLGDLHGADVRTRRAAAYQLGRSGDASVVAPLIAAYDDGDSSVCRNVIESLGRLGTPEAQAFLSAKGLPVSVQDADWTAVAEGFVATLGVLAGAWIPAYMIDYQANSQYPGSGAGATLVAMFFCTPGALGVGVLMWAVLRARHQFAKEKRDDESRPVIVEFLVAVLTGLAMGGVPWLILEALYWSGLIPS